MENSSLSSKSRLAAIRRLGLLDSEPEEAFDRLTRSAAALLDAPIALCSVVAHDKQLFKSAYGVPEGLISKQGDPLTHSYCKHVVTGKQPFIVADARLHPILKDNPAIVQRHAIAYAGIPLMSADGEAVGSFCVVDNKPRQWTQKEIAVLTDLANAAMTEFRLRDIARELLIERQIREELIAAVAEDLADPITRLNLILESGDREDGLEAHIVEDARTESQLLALKVNEFLDVASVELGSFKLNSERFQLPAVIGKALLRLLPLAEEKHVSIEPEVPENFPPVVADPNIIERVLHNLLLHAIRFTDPGSTVWITLSEFGADEVRVAISDTGMGLTDEMRANIFTVELPDLASGEETPHSGLGLTYCRMAIEAHDGRIGVFSQEGIGTTLWFTLVKG
jgi:signal transduction histidine kinase